MKDLGKLDENGFLSDKAKFLAKYGSSEHVSTLIDHPDWYTRACVAENLNLSHEHVTKLANDPNRIVRRQLALNTSISDEHREKLINDPDENVSYIAKKYGKQ